MLFLQFSKKNRSISSEILCYLYYKQKNEGYNKIKLFNIALKSLCIERKKFTHTQQQYTLLTYLKLNNYFFEREHHQERMHYQHKLYKRDINMIIR